MCPPGYHLNGFTATPELGHRMYGSYTYRVSQNNFASFVRLLWRSCMLCPVFDTVAWDRLQLKDDLKRKCLLNQTYSTVE